jgi:WD40 repeat protein
MIHRQLLLGRQLWVLLSGLMWIAPFCCLTDAKCQNPFSFRYFRLDRDLAAIYHPARLVYDAAHGQFFFSVPYKNEIDVVSENAPSRMTRIDVPSPCDLDLSPDGRWLFAASYSQIDSVAFTEGYWVIDRVSLTVTGFVRATSGFGYLSFRQLSAMRNGKVFFLAGGSVGGLLEADPALEIAARPKAPGSAVSMLRKSADGSSLVWAGKAMAGPFDPFDGLAVYDSGRDAFKTQAALDGMVITDVTVSPDGSRILVNGHRLFDGNLHEITELIPGNTNGGPPAAFSPDGGRFYWAGAPGQGNVVRVFDADAGATIGDVPAAVQDNWRAIVVGSSGLAVLVGFSGVAVLDVSHPNANLDPNAAPQLCCATPEAGPASASGPTVLTGQRFESGAKLFFGGVAAGDPTNLTATSMTVQPPLPGSGPLDVVASFPNGWATYAPEAYSYGPAIEYQDVNAGDSAGGATIQIGGYGLHDPGCVLPYGIGNIPACYPHFSIGGTDAPIVSEGIPGAPRSIFPLELYTIKAPPGKPGMADLSVTSTTGRSAVPNGFRYILRRQIPGLLPAQMLLDEARARMYAVESATGDIKAVNLVTLEVSTLIPATERPAWRIALAPDGSRLLAVSPQGGTLTVFDLNSGAVLRTFYPTPDGKPGKTQPTSVIATSRGTALVGMADPALLDTGYLYEVDLGTGKATSIAVPSWFHITANLWMASSADGSRVYIAQQWADAPGSSGGVLAWDAALDGVVAASTEVDWEPVVFQVSTTAAGDRVLVNALSLDADLSRTSLAGSNTQTLTMLGYVLPDSFGGKIQSTGSLEYLPTTKTIEIYDVPLGELRLSLPISGGTASSFDGLVVDRAGSTLYVAAQGGVDVIDLGHAPLAVGSVAAQTGEGFTVLGSGFDVGATVAIDGKTTPAQVIDSTRIAIQWPAALPLASHVGEGRLGVRIPQDTPTVSIDQMAITVANPSGETYTLPPRRNPFLPHRRGGVVLSHLSPMSYSYTAPDGTVVRPGYAVVTVSGTGFTGASKVTFDGVAIQTSYVSSGQLEAIFYATPRSGPHTIAVADTTYMGMSNALTLNIP